jgi:Ca2+-transporting ATPase
MIKTAIALAVAAIPEGLPIVATIALARGMLRMARRNALINRLSSVETLGATSVIFSDKTGTLTENRMQINSIVFDERTIQRSSESNESSPTWMNGNDQPVELSKLSEVEEIIRAGVLCNNASLSSDSSEENSNKEVGDPLELALLETGKLLNLDRPALLEELPEVREEAFNPENKMMATFHNTGEGILVTVKGAPESVIPICRELYFKDGNAKIDDDKKTEFLERNRELASKGLKVLALAKRMVDDPSDDPYKNLVFLGMVGLKDPPREDVKNAIEACQNAGVRVVMVTGDHPATGRSIANQIGISVSEEAEIISGEKFTDDEKLTNERESEIVKAPVFARFSPKQKLDLIRIHQEKGSVVAMTGDGVNDAPALKKADIGIAMGKRGTQVAKEASDMILKDDSFSTIVEAIRYGRVIFRNIKKFVIFLLSGNVGEVLSVAMAALLAMPLPILPLQILFINLILDVFPALALGIGEGTKEIMQKPPRKSDEPVLLNKDWGAIIIYGILIGLAILGSLMYSYYYLEMPEGQAITISFMTLGFARLWHVFNMRDPDSSFFVNEITGNPYVWGAIVLCTALLLSAVYLPGLNDVLKTVNPEITGWSIVFIFSIIPFLIVQLYLFVRKIL